MDQEFWATLLAFSAFALAIEVSLRLIEASRKTAKAPDPSRLERFRNGLPPDPDG